MAIKQRYEIVNGVVDVEVDISEKSAADQEEGEAAVGKL